MDTQKTESVSPEDVLHGIRQAWGMDLGRHTSLALDERVSLAARAKEVRRILLPQLISAHPLIEIVRAGLDDIVAHANAFDRLAPEMTALLHARQLEEYSAVLEFLLKHPERYNEFRWRWAASPTAHAIRNRHFNLKVPLDPAMEKWIRDNAKELKEYLKINGPPTQDEKRWIDYTSWLTRISLAKIFEETGRGDSYSFKTYEWGSHATHFSPLAERYGAFQFGERTYVEQWEDFAEHEIHSMLRILLPVTANNDSVRSAHAALVAKGVYDLIKTDIERAARITAKHERLQMVVGEFLRDPPDPVRLRLILLGKPAEDPLLLKL